MLIVYEDKAIVFMLLTGSSQEIQGFIDRPQVFWVFALNALM